MKYSTCTMVNSAALTLSTITILLIYTISAHAQCPPALDHGIDLPTTQPLVLAHQGASGIYPAHTAAAYQLAIDQGADMIECDLSVTRDLELVCLHDTYLMDTTNVADVFSEDRMSTYFIDGAFRTDYFSIDFTLEEMKTIKMRQKLDYRDQSYNDIFPIVSFDEYIDIAQNASRPIGIYPEPKDSVWVNNLDIIRNANTSFEKLVVDAVHAREYMNDTDQCFLQSFSVEGAAKMAEMTSLPVVVLQGSGSVVSDNELEYFATFAYGIGVNKNVIVELDSDNRISEVTDLIDRAHAFGLRVHPYTARNEYHYLAYDYEQDPYLEYHHLISLGADGLFSDFPGTFKRYLNSVCCEDCI